MQGGLLPEDLARNAWASDLSFARRFGA